ncbi:TPA: hypothetical protein ACH3X2_006692 [Trebouxia sp. C0005]
MSPETLRQDLLGLRISNSDTNTILLPDSSQQHAFCARLFTLRELDCAVDLATLLQNLMLSAEACSKTHLSTFMHHCMTVYTHLGDPLYFMCGAPFEQLLLFEKPEDLADYAASQEYQDLVAALSQSMRENPEEVESAMQDMVVMQNPTLLLDAVKVCEHIISPEKSGVLQELCSHYNLVGEAAIQ